MYVWKNICELCIEAHALCSAVFPTQRYNLGFCNVYMGKQSIDRIWKHSLCDLLRGLN